MCLLLLQVIAPAALFLAAKVEEQPRKLEHVIKVAHACLNPQDPSPDIRSDVSVPLFFVLFFLTAKYSFSQMVRAVHTWLVASRDPSCVPPPGPTIGTSDGSFRILRQTLWDSSTG